MSRNDPQTSVSLTERHMLCLERKDRENESILKLNHKTRPFSPLVYVKEWRDVISILAPKITC